MAGLMVAAGGPAWAQGTRPVMFKPLAASEAQFAGFGPAGPFYPARAAERGLSGSVVLVCTPTAEGRLRGCKVVSESPGNLDFGRAAVVMATRGRITVSAPVAVGEPVQVGVPFVLPANP